MACEDDVFIVIKPPFLSFFEIKLVCPTASEVGLEDVTDNK